MKQQPLIRNKGCSLNVLMKPLNLVILDESNDNLHVLIRLTASIPLRKLKGSRTGVFTGSFNHDYEIMQFRDPDNTPHYHSTGMQVVAANRLAYFFDFKGPSLNVDTACSGSFTALHLACQALKAGEADQALVSACSLMLDPDAVVGMNKLNFFSPEGRSFAFDSRGKGYGRGEGVACVVLKPLDAALADGNPIRAVIRATATNQNGRTQTITLPCPDAQVDVGLAAYESCGLNPKDTLYVEAHGTGTAAGDPLETEALGRIFTDAKQGGTTIVGSVKTNIGHLEPVSGLAALVKSVLILEKGIIPAHLNFVEANANTQLERWNIRIPTKAEQWNDGALRRISINNLGVGGSNAHVIVEDLETYWASTGKSAPSRTHHDLARSRSSAIMANTTKRIFNLSAMTEHSCKKRVQALKSYCETASHHHFDALAYTLSHRWEGFPWRWSVTASNMQELLSKMEEPSCDIILASTIPKIGFVFAGQGAQWFAMGRELLSSYPVFQETMTAADAIYRSLGAEWSLIEELQRDKDSSRVDLAEIGQPLSTALQVALVDLLRSWNISPDCVVGHSSGEIAAAYAAGALTLENTLTVSYFRGISTKQMQALENAPDGTMMAAGLSEEEAETEISQLPSEIGTKLVVACVNSPQSVTISGNRTAILAYREILNARGVFARALKIDVAYHSNDMKLVADGYLQAIAHCFPENTSTEVKFWSSVHAAEISTKDLQPSYWIENLVSKVKFSQAVSAMQQGTDSLSLLVECSPHSVLEGPIKQIVGTKQPAVTYTSLLRRNANAVDSALQAVQKIVSSGAPIDIACANFPLLKETTDLLTDLPSYAWDHSSRYWFESAITARHLRRSFPYHELLGGRVPHSTPIEPQWRNVIRISALDWLSDHRVNEQIVFPGAGYLAIAMQAFQQYYIDKEYKQARPKYLELRDVTFERGLLLDHSAEIEIVCYLRPVYENVRESAESSYEFRVVSSSDTTTWQKHCRGTISAVTSASSKPDFAQIKTSGGSFQDLERKEAYKKLENMGLNYGPAFKTLIEGSMDDDEFEGYIQQAKDNGIQNSEEYIVHPTTLDGIFQSLLIAQVYNGNCTTAFVPTSMAKLTVACDGSLAQSGKLLVRSTSQVLSKSALNGSIYVSNANSDLSVYIEGFSAVKLETELEPDIIDDHGCYQLEWSVDPDTMDNAAVQAYCVQATPNEEPRATVPLYDNAARHFYQQALIAVPDVDTIQADHHKHLWRYMHGLIQSKGAPDAFDTTTIEHGSVEAEMLRRVGLALPEIIQGKTDALSLMLEDNLLYRYYNGEWVDYYYAQMCHYIKLLGNKNPAMKILEIGAGTGGTTRNLLKALPSQSGFSYDFTDISAGFFVKARELLAAYSDSIRYQKLNIETDPCEQGFEAGKYDLIVASNVLHATKNIRATLENSRKLLKPGGRLLLLEVTRPTSYLHLVFGCLEGWWLGSEDNRTEGPCLDGASWVDILKQTGFSSATCIPDAHSTVDSMMSVIVATAEHEAPTALDAMSFAIVADYESNLIEPAGLEALLKQNYSMPCSVIGWDIPVTQNDICVFVGSATTSLLLSGDESRFRAFQEKITSSGGAVILTSGATGIDQIPNSAILTGLSRTIRSEIEDMKFVTIDIESASDAGQVSEIIGKCFLGDSKETEYAIRQQTVSVPRLLPQPAFSNLLSTGDFEETRPVDPSQMAVKLDFKTPGYLESLRFVPDNLTDGALLPDELQIEVKAIGVNFRHVLYALGKFSAAEYAARPAGECSGVVTAVGAEYKDKFQIGDRIVTSGIFNAFTTAVRCPAEVSRRIPDTMDFVTAAQFPLTYITAWYALVDMARLRKRHSVLIHSATGAVGQAAITIAQHFGARIFATCGNDEKKAFLVSEYGIPEENIFSSKDFSFVQGILDATKDGVDIILNSLSGEFITESCRCLATFGRFIEIGKNDILGRSKLDMGIFNKSTSFMALDLSRVYELDREIIGEMLEKILGLLTDGTLKKASPVHVRKLSDAAEAFRFMSTGKHIGKMVLDIESMSEIQVTIPNYGSDTIKSRGSGTYVIAGGLGGLGKEICQWMVKHDADNLVVLSRSGPDSADAQSLSAQLRKQGATLHVLTCDVGDDASVSQAVEHCKQNLPPIRGVIQGAMVLRDIPFENMSADQFRQVILPKVHGTQNLVKHMPPSTLDFFIILSSVVGIIGGESQGSYVAASTFQDNYARYLTSIGQPTTCLDLGWIQGAGYVEVNKAASAFVAKKGMKPVPIDALFQGLSYAMAHKPSTASESQITLGLSETLSDRFTRDPKFSFLKLSRSATSAGPSTGPAQTKSAQQVLHACKSYVEATTYICQRLLEKISALMAIPLSNLKLEASVSDYGIDSLIAIEIRNWMRQELGCSLGTFEIIGSNSIRNLGEVAALKSKYLAESDFSDGPAVASTDSATITEPLKQAEDSGPPSVPISQVIGDLPSLPVPTLEVTAASLTKSLRTLLSDEDYNRSKAQIDAFVAPAGPGQALQARLLEKAKTSRNWLSDTWIDTQYLELRTPIAPFTNYFGVHQSSSIRSVSRLAAIITSAVLKFQEDLEKDALESDRLRDALADMSQYKNMFNACRIATKPKDFIHRFEVAKNRHIAIIRDGKFYKLNYVHQGQRLGLAQLKAAFDAVLASDASDKSLEVGAFTTGHRDSWAEIRADLMASSIEAKQAIDDIESSVFVLCLDSAQPETVEELAAQVWTGNNGVNRYFDKPVQFVVTGNARSGYVGEHSACDGAPSLRLNEFVQGYIQEESAKSEEDLTSTDSKSFATSDINTGFELSALPIPATADFSRLAKNAITRFSQTVSSDDMAALRFDKFGEAAFTSRKRSPNTSVQLILNLAAYRMYGKLRPNYEPVSLSSFAGGRWTTCSMIIPEVLKFCQLADDPDAKGTARLDAYENAVKAHGKNVSTVANGHENTEAHLLALQKMLNEDEDTPELFLDDGFAQSQSWSLSASFMHSKHEMHYGFWPVTDDGLGLGHMIRDDRYVVPPYSFIHSFLC